MRRSGQDSVEKTREKFEDGRAMGRHTALTVSFIGSIPISRDTSRLCNSCRQLSSITPGIPASVSSVRGGKHGLPPRRGQTPGFRVCQPLLHDPKPSGGERCCPSDFHLASRRPRQIRKRRIDILDEIATSKSRRFVVSEFFY